MSKPQRYKGTWVKCCGWGGFPCQAGKRGAAVLVSRRSSRHKRCLTCAQKQHRQVVNASHRRNWPKYRQQRHDRLHGLDLVPDEGPKRRALKALAAAAGLVEAQP